MQTHVPVSGFAGGPEAFFPVALIVLLLRDLLHLVEQLSHAQLQLRQLVLGSDLSVVIRVFAHLKRGGWGGGGKEWEGK